jgi:hypothetical protein
MPGAHLLRFPGTVGHAVRLPDELDIRRFR